MEVAQVSSLVATYFGSVVLSTFICLFAWHLWSHRSQWSPPGTNGIPFLGVVLSLRGFPGRTMAKWAKKYGPFYMVKFGTFDVVVISSPEIAYEAFAKNDCFNDRPQTLPVFNDFGIMFTNYTDFHKEQRRFGLNTLREFGMGRRSLEPRLVEVAEALCGEIDALCVDGKSEPFDIQPQLYTNVSSVISYIVFGRDVAKDNEEFRNLINRMITTDKTSVLSGVLMFAPFLRFLPVFSGVWKSSREFRVNVEKQIMPEIDAHRQSRDPKNPRDFIDCFLNAMDKAEERKRLGLDDKDGIMSTDDENANTVFRDWSSYSIQQAVSISRDLFLAGTDTTSSSLAWLILYLCKYPEVQKKMQQEIDDVLGQSGVPRMSIMEKLPYVRAVIQEVTRIRPTVPLAVPHLASRDASLLGYRIPKGAIILTNIWAIHHDETRWPEPDKFSPERHLDEDGKFIKSSHWMIFNVGGRNCLGQQLAKMELFITTVTLFRRFQFELPLGASPDMNGEHLVTLRPFGYKVIATQR